MRVRLTLLQQTFLASSAVHLALLLVTPAPRLPAAPQAPMTVELSAMLSLPSQPLARLQRPDLPPEPAPSVAEPPAADAPEPTPRHTPEFLQLELPSFPSSASAAASEAGEESGFKPTAAQAATIDELLARTRKSVAEQDQELELVSYRFRVRERLRVMCQRYHPGARLVGSGRQAFLFDFVVQADGAVSKVEITLGPGASPLAPGLLTDLRAFGPLAPPPSHASLPLVMHFQVYFE